MELKKYFEVAVNRYVAGSGLKIYRPASLNRPKDNAVMFITDGFMQYADALFKCKDCLVFWPRNIDVPDEILKRHAICKVESPHKEFARFFNDNSITYLPEIEEYDIVNDAYIAKGAVIGNNCKIFPGVYISSEVIMGDNVYIGSGTKLLGEVHLGNNVVIRENTVIGADGLTTDRDENGKALTIPQFGGVIIEDDVQIGALTVIGRGAIDNTVLKRGSKVDNCTFISHNVILGEDTFVVGETILFGSSSTGKQAFISGNSSIREGRHIGERAVIGMGSVVVRNVEDGAIVKGNPAK